MNFQDIPFIYLHFFFLSFSFVWIFISDHYGFNWIRGKVEKLDQDKLHKYHKMVNIGLYGLVFSGAMLISQMPYKLESTQFWFKMSFVLTLVVNSFVIGKFMKLSGQSSFKNLSKRSKIILLSSGTVSTICWVSAFIMAKFI